MCLDFKRVFAGKTFSVNSRNPTLKGKKVYNVPIITDYVVENGKRVLKKGLWDYHFSDVSFIRKLSGFNRKIELYRDTFRNTGSIKQAYLALLSKYPIGYDRFYDKANEFANRMKMAACLKAQYQNRYPLNSLGYVWHVYLTKVVFEMYKTLDQF